MPELKDMTTHSDADAAMAKDGQAMAKDTAAEGSAPGTPKAKDGPLKDVTVKVAQALGTMLNRKLKDGGYDKKQACKRLCWQVQQLATAHMFFLAATSSPAAGVQDTIEDLDKECIAVVDDVFSSLDRKGPLKPHELCKLGHTVQSTMGRIDEESSEYYAALAQISTNMRKGQYTEGDFSDAEIEAKIVQMKEANAWTAAQLGQIKMAGDEAKTKEAGPDGADEPVVRQAKADAKKAAKKAAKWKIACGLLYSEENNISDQAKVSERIALLLKKRVVSDTWHIEGEGDSASGEECPVASKGKAGGAKKRAHKESESATTKKQKRSSNANDNDGGEDNAAGV